MNKGSPAPQPPDDRPLPQRDPPAAEDRPEPMREPPLDKPPVAA